MSIALPPFLAVVWSLVFFLFFYSFLCRGKFPVGYRGCETVVGWEFSSALGPGRDWLCLFLSCWAGEDLVSVPSSSPVGQTGETGTEGWFATRPAAPGFVGAAPCHLAPGALQVTRALRVPSGCTFMA